MPRTQDLVRDYLRAQRSGLGKGEIYSFLAQKYGLSRDGVRGRLSVARQRGWLGGPPASLDEARLQQKEEQLEREARNDPFGLLNRLAEFQDFVNTTTEIRQTQVSYNLDQSRIFLIGWGDLHLDSLHSDIPRLKRELELMKALQAYVVFLGDATDNPIKYQDFDTLLQPKASRLIWARLMDSLGDRLLALFTGCHEAHGYEKADMNYLEEYCRDRGKPYLGERGRLFLHLKKVDYSFGLGHKLRGFSTYNPFHAGVRLLREDFPDVDGVLMGHLHQSGIAIQVEGHRQKVIMAIGTRKVGDHFAERAAFVGKEENKLLPVLELDGLERGFVLYNDIEVCARKHLGGSE